MNDFHRILDICLRKKLFTKRVKSFIEYNKINNVEDLEKFINEPLQLFKTMNFGAKTLYDIKTFRDYLISSNQFNNIMVFNENDAQIDFMNSVKHYCETNSISNRAINLIVENNINNSTELESFIDKANSGIGIEYVGLKTIRNLQDILNFIAPKTENISDELLIIKESFFLKFQIEINDLKLLESALNKELDVPYFIEIYFENIFHGLSKSTKIKLKQIFSFELEMNELEKLKNHTKERQRQINKSVEAIDYSSFYETIKYICSYSKIDYTLTKPVNDINLLFNQNINLSCLNSRSSAVYKFILCVINYDNYISFNIFDLYIEKTTSLNDLTYSYLINRNLFTIEEVSIFKTEMINLDSSKFYKSILIDKIFLNYSNNSNDILEFIKEYIKIRKHNHKIFINLSNLENSKKMSPADLIETYLKKFDTPKSLNDIFEYCNSMDGQEHLTKDFIRYTIQRNSQLFYNLGKTGYYGLIGNGGQKIYSIKDQCIEILKNNDGPVHKQEFLKYFKAINDKFNDRSVEEVLRMYDCFKSIGQSFFVLTDDKKTYEEPLHWKSFNSLLNNHSEFQTIWFDSLAVTNFFEKIKMPQYQKNVYYVNHFFIHKSKATINFELVDPIVFRYLLDDIELGKQIIRAYKQLNIYNELDLKIIFHKYINKNSIFISNQIEANLIIKYHLLNH
jgi:hypothetical protein